MPGRRHICMAKLAARVFFVRPSVSRKHRAKASFRFCPASGG